MPDNKMSPERLVEILRQELDKKKKSIENLNRAVTTLISVKQELNKKNEILVEELKKAQQGLKLFQQEIEKLTAPPNGYAFVVRVVDKEKRTVDIFFDNRSGRQMVTVIPKVNIDDLKFGVQVRLNEANVIIAIDNDLPLIGSEAYFDGWISKDRLRVIEAVGDEKLIVFAADSLPRDLDIGDALRVYGGFAFEKLEKTDGDEYFLTEIPDVTFDDIGGLDQQIEIIKNEIELPFLNPKLYNKYELSLPKGILFFGPPGCGKTLIAKAMANYLSLRTSERLNKDIKPNFININGPELLNKYVGETERAIRVVFKKAEKTASLESPTVIFFDEADAFLSARGSGISSDMEKTVIPQFCSMLDGLIKINNVIVVCATNRQDLLDPAVLRPGRLDIKIKVDRPDEKNAELILRKKIKATYDFHQKYAQEKKSMQETIDLIVKETINCMFSKEVIHYKNDEGKEQTRTNKYVEIITEETIKTPDQNPKILYYADLICSGAVIGNIVMRAKKIAVKMENDKKEPGLRARYFCAAVQKEYDENEDLPNTTNPSDWAKILGIKEKVINVRFVRKEDKEETRRIETITTGHYL